MSIRVDEEFLAQVGLADMPEEEKTAFINLAQSELETRVGRGLEQLLSADELEEFEHLQNAEDATVWLSQHAPTYREMTMKVFADFRKELLEEKDEILGKNEPHSDD